MISSTLRDAVVASANGASDSELVSAARTGDEAAFSQLVERYQNRVCSFIFALTGNLGHSEEIAQETFVSAWTQLEFLREPEHFRGWLFVIARNFVRRAHKRHKHPRPSMSVPLFEKGDLPSSEPSPLERIISVEEEHVVWRALRGLPERYRVPLVLFYREQKSIEKVAEALNLSEGNVKMRLSRGRKMLQDKVAAVLESALERSAPQGAFMASVMSAVAVVGAGAGGVASAHAAGRAFGNPATRPLSAVTAKGGKALLIGGGLVALVIPLIPVLTGQGFLGFHREADRAGLAAHEARSPALASANLQQDLPRLATGTPAIGEDTRAEAFTDDGTAGIQPFAPREVLLSYDFEDGVVPEIFVAGQIVTGAMCGAGRSCMMATFRPWLKSWDRSLNEVSLRSQSHGAVFRYSDTAVLSFDYWLGAGEREARVILDNHHKGGLYHELPDLVNEAWTHVEILVSDFFGRGKELPSAKGDHFCDLTIRAGRVAGNPFYVDNLKVVDYGDASRLPKRLHGRNR
jgi:RNA polymerase sigma factor (sigma-70 family)